MYAECELLDCSLHAETNDYDDTEKRELKKPKQGKKPRARVRHQKEERGRQLAGQLQLGPLHQIPCRRR